MKRLFLVMALSGLGLTATQAQTAPATTPAPATKATVTTPASAPTQASPSMAAHPQMQAPMTADLVPDAVKTKFAADYPAIKDAHWRKMGNNYQAYYRDNNNTGNVMYSSTGAFLRSFRQVDISTLPQPATDYLAKNNTGQPVKTAMEIKEANGNVRYQVMANGKGLSFDGKGNVITPTATPAQTTKSATLATPTAPATNTPK